ncbi:MAG: hypothetical protein MK074_05135 [Phycisphaerales bacterium]|nr:hypothetical protein [Phycisphaerales bacterium]
MAARLLVIRGRVCTPCHVVLRPVEPSPEVGEVHAIEPSSEVGQVHAMGDRIEDR